MKVSISIEKDSDNSRDFEEGLELKGDASLSSSIELSLENPKRVIRVDADELLRAVRYLVE